MMASFNLANVGEALDDVTSLEDGISFAGLAKKWETEEDVKDLIKAIDGCKKLCFLDLEGNTLGCKAAKPIGEALKKHPEFQRAQWKDMFTGRMKTEIPSALNDLSNGVMFANARLTVLDLSDNALGPNGFAGLVGLISSSSCFSLQELRLMNCGLGITGAKMLAKALTTCFKKSVEAGTPLELRVFAAGRNRLENEGAKALSAIFGEIQTLEEITIPQNGIYHPGITALAAALKKNINMQVINFNDNTITAKGAEPLAEAFYSIEALREINLGDCLLKDEGGQILSDVLADCHPDLEYLNLSGNEIGMEVGIAIVSAMGHKDFLRELNLDCNQFGEDGIEEIQNIMEGFAKLDVLSVEDDEGEAEDDEEQDDDDQGEEGEDPESEHESGEESDCVITETSANFSQQNFETSLDCSILLNSSVSDEDPVATFYNSKTPNIDTFNQIKEENKLKAFKDFLSNSSEDDYLTHLVFAILKLASISEHSQEAKATVEQLFKEAFEYGRDKDRIKSIRNFFLIQLGLLKSEEKKFTPKYNMKSCREALANAINENWLPEDEKHILKHFLGASEM